MLFHLLNYTLPRQRTTGKGLFCQGGNKEIENGSHGKEPRVYSGVVQE